MKILLTATALLLTGMATGQQTLNASGHFLSSPTMSVEYSLGESVVFTLGSLGANAYTQGVLQPDFESTCLGAAPIALPDGANLPADALSVSFNPLLNDLLPPGQSFFLEIGAQPLPTNGMASVEGDSTLIFERPHADSAGLDSFLYRVCIVGCPALCAEAWVKISFQNKFRYYSNVLTPGEQDGKNDLFDPVFDLESRPAYAGRRVAEAKLTIYNRWGEIIFRETGPEPVWNGFAPDGKHPMPQATYYFILQATDDAGNDFPPEYGTISVLR